MKIVSVMTTSSRGGAEFRGSGRADWKDVNDARFRAGERIGITYHVASVLVSYGFSSPTYFPSPNDVTINGGELKLQAIDGRTRMGYPDAGRRWVDDRFRSAFALLTHAFGSFGIAARAEAFDTRNRGSDVGSEYDDNGWSAMLAAKREWRGVTGLVELLHVSSRRDNRDEAGLRPRQRQTQLQAEARIRW